MTFPFTLHDSVQREEITGYKVCTTHIPSAGLTPRQNCLSVIMYNPLRKR